MSFKLRASCWKQWIGWREFQSAFTYSYDASLLRMGSLVSLLCHRFIIKIFGMEYFWVLYLKKVVNALIDVGIIKRVFLLASYVKFLSCISISSMRMASKAFTACSLFTTVTASCCAKRSKHPWNARHSENAYSVHIPYHAKSTLIHASWMTLGE